MCIWTEGGRIVRAATPANVKERPKGSSIPEDIPQEFKRALTAISQIPDTAGEFLADLRAWAAGGPPPSADVIGSSHQRTPQQAEAHACFDLGTHLWEAGDKDGARTWFKRAHELDPDLWTAKRQAWTFETTPEGGESDLMQAAHDVYGTSWIDDIEKLQPQRYYSR